MLWSQFLSFLLTFHPFFSGLNSYTMISIILLPISSTPSALWPSSVQASQIPVLFSSQDLSLASTGSQLSIIHRDPLLPHRVTTCSLPWGIPPSFAFLSTLGQQPIPSSVHPPNFLFKSSSQHSCSLKISTTSV